MTARRFTLADVRRSYTPDKRWSEMEGDLPSFLLYRPLSILLTPAAIAIGISPTAVSLGAMTIALAMPFVAWFGGAQAYLWIALLAFVIHICDCLDGNIARTTGQSSKVGGLIDGFVDVCFWTIYFASLGILVVRAPEHAGQSAWMRTHGIEVAMTLAVLVILHRQLRDAFALTYGLRAEFTPHAPKRLSAWAILRMVVISFERFYLFAILAGGWLGRLDLVLGGISVYVVFIFVCALWVTFAAALQRDR